MEQRGADLYATARNVADNAVDAFSEAHPGMRMNVAEWQDLKESIYREVLGAFSKPPHGKP